VKFLVNVHQYRNGTIHIDADDEDDAVVKAEEEAAGAGEVSWDLFEVEVLDVKEEKGGDTHGQEGKDRQEGKGKGEGDDH